MNRWKRTAMAAVLAILVLVGSWGGLLVGQRSAQTMGKDEQALPRLRLEPEGGMRLAVGTREWRAEPQTVREVFAALGKMEWMMPRSLRVTGLAALSGLWWRERNPGYSVGKKLLADAPAPLETKDDDSEKV